MPTKSNRTPELLTDPRTAEEVCKMLGIGRATLTRMQQDGVAPPHYNMGGRHWFEADEVRTFFQQLRVEPTAPIETIREAYGRQGAARGNPFRSRKPKK